MDFLAIVVVILVIANIVWALSHKGPKDWPLWVNLIGSVILAVATFKAIL